MKSMNAEVESVRKWLHGNKLILNAAKKASMITGTDRKLHQDNSGEPAQAHFKILGEAIEQIKSVQYLGVIFG